MAFEKVSCQKEEITIPCHSQFVLMHNLESPNISTVLPKEKKWIHFSVKYKKLLDDHRPVQ